MAENWIQTDEAEDVAGSIRHALLCYERTSEDTQAWKWMALSLHSALQGACVCHLVTTAPPNGAITPRNTKDWLEYFNKVRENPDITPPNTNLMTLPNLLKSVRKANSAGDNSNNHLVKISDNELEWLERFHRDIRNQFVHFEPMGWSIEISGMSGLAVLIARIIEDILSNGWAFRHQDGDWRDRFSSSLHRLSNLAQPP